MEKQWKMLEKELKWNLFKKDDQEKKLKKQSKLTFYGILKSYTYYDSYTFRRNEVLMDEPIYLGFAILKLSKLIKYGT